MTNAIEKKAADTIRALVESEGYKLYDVVWTVDFGHNILRILIEKEVGGISLDDCVKVSHLVEDILEVKEVVPRKYNLEVSSPGMDRPLGNRNHFERVVGQEIRVKTFSPIEGRRQFKGVLTEVKNEDISIQVDNQNFMIPLEEISKANLEVKVK